MGETDNKRNIQHIRWLAEVIQKIKQEKRIGKAQDSLGK
jgi:hypothetical protein